MPIGKGNGKYSKEVRAAILELYKPGDIPQEIAALLSEKFGRAISNSGVRRTLQQAKVYVPVLNQGRYAHRWFKQREFKEKPHPVLAEPHTVEVSKVPENPPLEPPPDPLENWWVAMALRQCLASGKKEAVKGIVKTLNNLPDVAWS